jgi:hypothetical protein
MLRAGIWYQMQILGIIWVWLENCWGRRKFFGTLYNTYSFFSLYANDGLNKAEIPLKKDQKLINGLFQNTLIKSGWFLCWL